MVSAADEQLIKASLTGDISRAQALLRSGADLACPAFYEGRESLYGSPFCRAVEKGDVTLLSLFSDHLEASPGGSSIEQMVELAMDQAALFNQPEAAIFLLQRFKQYQTNFSDALLTACATNHRSIVDALLENQDFSKVRERCLQSAMFSRSQELVDVIIDRLFEGKPTLTEPVYESMYASGNADMIEHMRAHGYLSPEPEVALRGALKSKNLKIIGTTLQEFPRVTHEFPYLFRMPFYQGDLDTALCLCLHGAPHLGLSAINEDYCEAKVDRWILRVFSTLADQLIQRKNSREEFCDYLQISGDSLPDRAWDCGTNQAYPNILRISLCAAAVASSFHRGGGTNNALHILQQLISEDIHRISAADLRAWSKYPDNLAGVCQQITSFTDVIDEVAASLVLPVLVQQRNLTIDPNDADSVELAMEKARVIAAFLVVEGKSTNELFGVIRSWHRPGNALPSELRPFIALGEWNPLFEGILELGNGYTAKALTDHSALRAEGTLLGHCVGHGSYTSECLLGNAHIVSIQKDGVRVATVEFKKVGRSDISDFTTVNGEHWRRTQSRGELNKTIDEENESAVLRLVSLLKQHLIFTTSFSGETPESSKKRSQIATPLELTIGYSLADAERLTPLIIRHYQERVFHQRKNGSRVPLIRSPEHAEIFCAEEIYFPGRLTAFKEQRLLTRHLNSKGS